VCQGALADLWAWARDAVAQHGLWLALRQRGNARPAGLVAWQAHLGQLLVALLSVGGVVASPSLALADPAAWGVWQRAARSTRWQLLGLDVWAWVSAPA
jgi:hypothetical protein